jgi:hypothetical protein
MSKKILLAGVLAGIALFIWGSLSHTVLKLGDVGVHYLPQQAPVVDTMKAAIPHSGFYIFPQADNAGKLAASDENGPWGVLVYRSAGASMAMGRQLSQEFVLNIVQGLLVAYLLSLVPGLAGYTRRVGYVVVLGVLVALATNVEYWIWYGFPRNYTVGAMTDKFIGMIIVGLVVAAVVKPTLARVETMQAKAA